MTDVWNPIESRQFIGWWRDAVSDAITSSAYTGERAIHSSDFSAFTKRSDYPSLLRFSGPITAYSDTIHPFALRWLPTVELWYWRILTLKVVLLLALTSLKRVGDLHKWPCSLSLAMFPRSCPHRFALRWSNFTLSILLPLLRVRMRDFTCSARFGHWSCMWITPRFGEKPPSYWCVLVLAAAGLPRQSRGFPTGWETPFRWLMRCRTFLHLLVFGRILLGA